MEKRFTRVSSMRRNRQSARALLAFGRCALVELLLVSLLLTGCASESNQLCPDYLAGAGQYHSASCDGQTNQRPRIVAASALRIEGGIPPFDMPPVSVAKSPDVPAADPIRFEPEILARPASFQASTDAQD